MATESPFFFVLFPIFLFFKPWIRPIPLFLVWITSCLFALPIFPFKIVTFGFYDGIPTAAAWNICVSIVKDLFSHEFLEVLPYFYQLN